MNVKDLDVQYVGSRLYVRVDVQYVGSRLCESGCTVCWEQTLCESQFMVVVPSHTRAPTVPDRQTDSGTYGLTVSVASVDFFVFFK